LSENGLGIDIANTSSRSVVHGALHCCYNLQVFDYMFEQFARVSSCAIISFPRESTHNFSFVHTEREVMQWREEMLPALLLNFKKKTQHF
jgi:hypothetical protein